MAKQVIFEVHVSQNGRWEIQGRHESSEMNAAIADAKGLDQLPNIEMVKVILEEYDDETGHTTENIVYRSAGMEDSEGGPISMAAKIKGDATNFMVMFGDGSSSRGEFHSALNFAGVHKPPVVFICENNGWAISTPQSTQTASATYAEKGDAYGVRNLVVDGNDALAVYSVVKEARDMGHDEGATLIEAVTYRMGYHTSSDNPDLYREQADVDVWVPWDPLTRLRKYLERRKLWNKKKEDALWTRCKAEISAAIKAAEAMDFPTPATMFDDTYEEQTWLLQEQKAHLLADIAELERREGQK